MKIKTAALFYNAAKEQSQRIRKNLAARLKSAGIVYYELDSASQSAAIKKGTDIIFCIGGDGTLLKAARMAAGHGVRLIGVNGGSLGFLSAAEAGGDFRALLNSLKKGDFTQSPRLMLDVRIMRGNKKVFTAKALNECVIKAEGARAVSLNLFYNSSALKTYFGDGIIICTPTGSTAYNLAADGPVVYPAIEAFILTAICPHTLTQRPLVLPADRVLKAALTPRKNGPQAALNIDGQIHFPVAQGDEIIISKSTRRARIIYPKDYNFFDVLTAKLKWGSR